MNLTKLALRELGQRKVRLAASFLALALSLAMIVAVQSVSDASRRFVAEQLERTGASAVAIPRDLSLTDYYRGRTSHRRLPDHYLTWLQTASPQGVRRWAARITGEANLRGERVLVTGIDPHKDLSAIAELAQVGDDQVVVGSELAAASGISPGTHLQLGGQRWKVAAVIAETGSVDDVRLFTTLKAARAILGGNDGVSEIAFIIDGDLAEVTSRLGKLLGQSRIIHMEQLWQAQTDIQDQFRRYSLILLTIVLLAGGLSMANHILTDVRQREQEIATLLALGATPLQVVWLFLAKAMILGLLGGAAGYVGGTAAALVAGPTLAAVSPHLSISYLGWSVLAALAVCSGFSLPPAALAARVDPATVFQKG